MHFSRPLPRPSVGKLYPRAVLRCTYLVVVADKADIALSSHRQLGCRELPPAGLLRPAHSPLPHSKELAPAPGADPGPSASKAVVQRRYTTPEQKWSDWPDSHRRSLRPERSALTATLQSESGRNGGLRSRDLMLPEHARYQAALRSESGWGWWCRPTACGFRDRHASVTPIPSDKVMAPEGGSAPPTSRVTAARSTG